MTTAVATDKKAIMRDKRAQGIAAMGLVNREGDHFRVTTPSLRGKRASYEVWRDEAGKVRCSCLEFEEQATTDSTFRCEHILAVKHSLLTKTSEAVTKQPDAKVPPGMSIAAVYAPADVPDNYTEENASEKREATPAAEATTKPHAPKRTPRFAREQIEQPETAAAEDEPSRTTIAAVETLAEHTTQKELEMSKKDSNTAVYETEQDFMQDDLGLEADAQTGAPVVPLTFTNTLRTLRQPIDPKFVKTREGWIDRQGNRHMVEYVEWHTVADLLDRIVPTWSHSVRGIVQIGDMVAVTAAITIDGVTREGVGTGTADTETGIKKAEHDALKRAAIKFGIARELYQRESDVIETEGSVPPSNDFPRDPLAKSMADLVTPKQLGMIRALAREANVDVEDECQQVLKCRTEELSKRAASSFIDHLKGLQHEAGGQMRRAS